jgi:hypothetical protein
LRHWLEPGAEATRKRANYAKPEVGERHRERMRVHYEEMDGETYNRKLLKLRRAKALQRRAEREQRRAA